MDVSLFNYLLTCNGSESKFAETKHTQNVWFHRPGLTIEHEILGCLKKASG